MHRFALSRLGPGLMLMLALVLWLGGGVGVNARQMREQVPLGAGHILAGGEYSTGGGITVAVELRNLSGETGLCGIWAESERLPAYVRHDRGGILAKGSIALNGQVLTHDLDFLNQVPPSVSYVGAPAGCIRLDRPWRDSDAKGRLEIRLPRRELRFGGGDDRGGGIRIRFTRSNRANPALTDGSVLPASWTRLRQRTLTTKN